MSDRKFYINNGPFNLSQIAELIACQITEQEGKLLIHNVVSLADATEKDLTFLNNDKYLKNIENTKAAACIVSESFAHTYPQNMIILKAKNPYFAYAKLVDLFYSPAKTYHQKPSAYISSSAKIGKNCYIGHNAVIEDEVEIGDDSIIEAGSFIDYGVQIGKRAKIYSGVSISNSIIGDDVVILPGARIGQDGFGFATERGAHKKIYHIGRVLIGNDVEIGAGSTIDRGSMKDTIIEDFCRIDNLVQIGHNVLIKRGTILVAQVGIAGSSTIGSYCALGGQVGIAGHVTITDQVQIAGQGGVMQDINEPGIMGGSPAVPIRDWHKQTILLRKLINEKRK